MTNFVEVMSEYVGPKLPFPSSFCIRHEFRLAHTIGDATFHGSSETIRCGTRLEPVTELYECVILEDASYPEVIKNYWNCIIEVGLDCDADTHIASRRVVTSRSDLERNLILSKKQLAKHNSTENTV